ncbi:glycosyltransferase family 2 protein [bacterium]|nr:glycosyltransferase family 2 protein [bacterium]
MRRSAGPATLYIVIPCYNEEAVLPITSRLFVDKIASLVDQGKVSPLSRILFVNDGSSDATWELIHSLCQRDERCLGISLSRNRGHQNALLAGLMEARGRCDLTISIDCDGQDDINAMDQMIDAYLDGCDVVYGVRSDRSTDSFFKRESAQAFYRLMRALGADVVYNHADYRLLSSRVLDSLAQYREVNLFLRGMIPLVGFHSTSVYYVRHERLAGKSHYPLKKMVSFAVDGITSLSTKPLRIISILGFLVFLASVLAIVWAFAARAAGVTVPGWASTMVVVSLFGGVQLLCLGVIGEYVGKTYMETKRRPRFIVAERTEYDRAESAERDRSDSAGSTSPDDADAPGESTP